MEHEIERLSDAIVDLGAVAAETRGGASPPMPDTIGDFSATGLSDD